MSHAIAIVGSGPSGFYALDGLTRALPAARIDLFDRLPTPYGLVRSGVAPDHQGTKAVARQFERLAQKPNVRFLGNVEIGRDLSLAELRRIYDAVILATGAARDRRLGIAGEDLPGVYPSWPVVGWYNGHPDFAELDFRLRGPAVAVIGNGNVAIDLVRVLAKTAEEMQASDLCAHAARVIDAATLTDIYMIGRRGPVEASFTSAELAELGQLARVRPLVEGAEIPPASGLADAGLAKVKDRNLEILRGFAAVPAEGKPIALHLLFNATPVAFEGATALERLVLRDSAGGRQWTLPVQTAITAIGYRSTALDEAGFDEARGVFANEGGEIAPGLYVVGWAKRGPSGVIATNRADSLAVVEKVAAFVKRTPAKADAEPALAALLAARALRPASFAAWLKLNHRETAAGAALGRPRVKLASWQALREALERD
ncbi:MAG: FAD-dependent oxidoreductase [Reyranellaceae bacterium]